MMNLTTIKQRRPKRIPRIRARLSGTPMKPRLSIFRSNTSLEAQIIDDENQKTIASCIERSKNMNAAVLIGTRIVEELKKRKIKSIVFDRRGNKYHGVIQKIADTVREGGMTV